MQNLSSAAGWFWLFGTHVRRAVRVRGHTEAFVSAWCVALHVWDCMNLPPASKLDESKSLKCASSGNPTPVLGCSSIDMASMCSCCLETSQSFMPT
eukprot:5637904-Amphidinium_carterae.1